MELIRTREGWESEGEAFSVSSNIFSNEMLAAS